MGVESLTHRDDGTRSFPAKRDEWRDWVSASRTRNYLIGDPILDWLHLYGNDNGYDRDDELPGYDERFDFTRFILAKANQFEAAVCRWMEAHHDFVRVGRGWADTQDPAAAERTWEEMYRGREIVAQGILWNPDTRTYGAPDLLVRSDILGSLFPDAYPDSEAPVPDSGLADPSRHYRVVDVKYTTLELLKTGHAAAKHKAYMAQVWLYNQALGRLQETTPPAAYLLGRAWKAGKARGDSALEHLARVDMDFSFRDGRLLADVSLEAVEWIRRVRTQGERWKPGPDSPDLVPSLSNDQDGPWHNAKLQIAEELGLENRSEMTDPLVLPTRVTVAEDQWRVPATAEFFVDFETVTDLDDDFSQFPEKGGAPILFMIGCGHFEDPDDPTSWTFEIFIADRLDETSERASIEAWLTHMKAVCSAKGTSIERSRLYHWSHHEPTFLSGAYNSCSVRHDCPEWENLPWVDLLKSVFRAQPIEVGGTSGSGLKEVARSMRSAGLIDTDWGDGPADGMGAQAGAWWCDSEAGRKGCRLSDVDLMRSIAEYNEMDCRVMAEILGYLREYR